jgi:hypothetical protein
MKEFWFIRMAVELKGSTCCPDVVIWRTRGKALACSRIQSFSLTSASAFVELTWSTVTDSRNVANAFLLVGPSDFDCGNFFFLRCRDMWLPMRNFSAPILFVKDGDCKLLLMKSKGGMLAEYCFIDGSYRHGPFS